MTFILKNGKIVGNDDSIQLKDHDELYSIASDSDISANVKMLASALRDGGMNIVIEDVKLLKYLFGKSPTSSDEIDLFSFLKEIYLEKTPSILWQTITHGIVYWVNVSTTFGEYEIKLPVFPNPTTVIIKWAYDKTIKDFSPKLFERKDPDKEIKGAHFIKINSPDFNKLQYVSIANTLKPLIQAITHFVATLKGTTSRIPPFIIKEKEPSIKSMTEFVTLLYYLFNKEGISTTAPSRPPTVDEVNQTPADCNVSGSATQLESTGGLIQSTHRLHSLEQNIPKLIENQAFDGVKQIKLNIDGKDRDVLKSRLFSEIEFIKQETSTNDLINTLTDLKKRMIETEFGKTEGRRTKTGTQLETSILNYTIHSYKASLEKIIKQMLVTAIWESDPNANIQDQRIFTKIQVVLNSDDIVDSDTLKFLIEKFQNEPIIVNYLVKLGTGIDMYEIKHGEEFNKNDPKDFKFALANPDKPTDKNSQPKSNNENIDETKKKNITGKKRKRDESKKIVEKTETEKKSPSQKTKLNKNKLKKETVIVKKKK